MKLATKTRYGVRALFDIAFHSRDLCSVQAKDVARREAIPLRYLEQILQELKRAGLIDSKRGPKGGYTLRRAASEIILGDVVRALQGPLDSLFLEDAPSTEPPASGPVTKQLWGELSACVREWFDGISLADLVERAKKLGMHAEDEQKPMYFI